MATILTHTMAASPGRLLKQHFEQSMDVLNSNARSNNAKIDVEDVFAREETSAGNVRQSADAALADHAYLEPEKNLLIETVTVDDEESEDEGGAVKIPQRIRRKHQSRTASVTASAQDEENTSNARSSSEESSSTVGVAWEGESDTGREREAVVANPNRCV